MNVVLYTRYSSDKQSETSTEQQLKVCRDYCDRNSFTIVAEYKDEAISGRTDVRPQFQKMIGDSKSKSFEGVIVYSIDRFGRNLYQSADYANKLEKNGVALLSATEPISDGTPASSLTQNILMAFAQYYSEELGQKISRGMEYNAEFGFVNGAQLPLGYKAELATGTNGKKRYAINETTAPIVRRIFEMYADEDKTTAEICRHFNEQGIRTARGGEFNKNSLRVMLRNKKYIGINTYKGIEFSGVIPQIIDDDLFERVQQALNKNKKATGRKKAVGKEEYLLSGKLFCGHCKVKMVGWSGKSKTGKKHQYYKCNNSLKKLCGKKNVRKQLVEDFVIAHCRAILTDENIAKIANEVVAYNEAEQRNNEIVKSLKKEIANNQKQQKNLMDTLKLCEDNSQRSMILSELSAMEKERSELQIQLDSEESRKITITRKEIRFFLMDLRNGDASDLKHRKALIKALIHKIYLYDDGKLTIICNNGDTTTEINTSLIDDIESDMLAKSHSESYYLGDSRPP